MDGLQVESLRPFIVVSSYAGAMTGLVIALVYHVHEGSFFGMLEATRPWRPVIFIPILCTAIFAKIVSDVGGAKMMNDMMSMQLKCWTSLQFWELVDSWSLEEYLQITKHYDWDEWVFPLLYSLSLMQWIVYEAAFSKKAGKKLASVALILCFITGWCDVVENQAHYRFLVSSNPRNEDRVERREWVTDTMIASVTAVCWTKFVTLIIVACILVYCRVCSSRPTVAKADKEAPAKIAKADKQAPAPAAKKDKKDTSEDAKKNQ